MLASRSHRLEMGSHLLTLISSTIVPVRGAKHEEAETAGKTFMYTRYSTLEQQKTGFSRPRQQSKIQEYANRHGLKIDRSFHDEATSGVTADRPQLRKLLGEAKKYPGSLVLMERPSRQAREEDAFLEISQALEEVGAFVIYANLGDVDADTVAQEKVKSSIEYHDILELLRDGREAAIMLGVWCGITPYGYRKNNDKQLVIHEEEAEVIRDIFAARIGGASPEQIARTLNIKGKPTPGSRRTGTGEWTKTKVNLILHRDAYDGRTIQHVPVFSWEGGVAEGGRKARRRRIELRTEHTRIVDHEDWLACQPTSRSTFGTTTREKFLLTSKVKCRYCGNNLVSRSHNDRYFLNCTHRSRTVACPELRFDMREIERLVIHAIGNAVAGEAESAFSAQLESLVQAEVEQARVNQARLRQEIAAVDDRLRQAADRIIDDGDFYEIYRDSLDEMARGLKSLKRQLAAEPNVSAMQESAAATSASLRGALETIGDVVPFRPFEADGRELFNCIREAIDHVELTETLDGRFDVAIHLSGAPWGVSSSMLPPQTFANRIVTDASVRRARVKRLIETAHASGHYLLDEERLTALGNLELCRTRFPTSYPTVVEAITLAVVVGATPERTMSLLQFSRNRKELVKGYWRTLEGTELRQRIAAMHGVELDESACRLRRSAIPTLRERLAIESHLLLRYPLADPSSTETEVPDRDFDVLIDLGLATPSGALRGSWKRSDRKYLDGLLWVVRNNARMKEIPQRYGNRTRLGFLIRDLAAANQWGPLVKGLLASRGIAFDAKAVVRPLNDPDMIERSRPQLKMPKPASFYPEVLKRGRKGSVEMRQRTLDEFNRKRRSA